MPSLILLSGPYGYFLAFLALVVLFISLRASWCILRDPALSPQVVRDHLNGLLFWGGVASILGFLGQCDGAYRAVSAILYATEISPSVVAEGFVISFVPTLFGLGILAFAVSAWASLRLLARGRTTTIPGRGILLLLVLLLFGCSERSRDSADPTPDALTRGVWSLEAGADEFLWEFAGDGEDLTCLVHDVVGGKKMNETPCVTASYQDGRVAVVMDTGVRLEGDVDGSGERISGHLLYPDGSEMEVRLPRRPRDTYPALLPLSSVPDPYRYAPPPDRGDGWNVASADDVEMSPQALEGLVNAVVRGEAGVLHSLLVARHGRLVLEEYFHGFGADDLHRLASCTKSVSSLLVGLAIQHGAIDGVHARLSDFFPEDRSVLGAGWERLTLEHLLTMSMALDWNPDEAENLHGTGPEFFRRVLARRVSGTPGADWAYVSANVNLIAGILNAATGMQAEAFAEANLFQPLGIRRWNWEYMKTGGFNLMDGSLELLPRDMARIGQMVLDGGRWEGRQILEEGWITATTTRHLGTGTWAEGYGYLWWLTAAPDAQGRPVQAVFANGWGSQFIAIFPTLDLVVVTTGGNEFNGKHLAVSQALGQYLLPSLVPGSP